MVSHFGNAGFVKGQWVEVKSPAEIAATLDANGKCGGLPFMPEMLAFCGKRFQVHRRAVKTCVEGYGMRRMEATVFLDGVRCDGAAHDGCQRDCLVFWKEAWLRPASGPLQKANAGSATAGRQCPVALKTREGERYYCQSTELAGATSHLSKWDLQHFFSEIRAGELTCTQLVRIVARVLVNRVRVLAGFRELNALAGVSRSNPRGDLDLREGDTVKVKSLAGISKKLDPKGRNCGLSFEPDMTFYAGQTFEVARRVNRIIREDTGRMVQIANTVALKGVVCAGVCSKNCPRANPHFWRESWLERGPEAPAAPAAVPERVAVPAE